MQTGSASEGLALPHGQGTRFTLLYLTEQAGNPDGAGTTSRHIGNPSHDTGTPAQVCSGQAKSLASSYITGLSRN